MKEIFKYKDLFVQLVSKDIKMRHKQTIFGIIWIIFQPLLSILIFSFVFGLIIKIPSNELPYPLFVFIGLNFWIFFSSAITASSGSLIGNESLIKKVYFPRAIIPLASIATNTIDLLISTVFLLLMGLYYGILPSIYFIVFYPAILFVMLSFLIGLSFFLSALNVRYRDVRQILPFFIQILIFLTPVFYPITIVGQNFQWVLILNPLVSIIETSRLLYLGNLSEITSFNIFISVSISIVTLLAGYLYFKKSEKYFADYI